MIMMLLPILGTPQPTDITPTNIVIVDEPQYDVEIVDAIENSVQNKDFAELGVFMEDSVTVFFESTDTESVMPKEEFIEFLDFVFQNTVPYSYEIYTIEDPEIDIMIYKLNYYMIVPDENGDPKLGLYWFAFSERDGEIGVVVMN